MNKIKTKISTVNRQIHKITTVISVHRRLNVNIGFSSPEHIKQTKELFYDYQVAKTKTEGRVSNQVVVKLNKKNKVQMKKKKS